MWEELIEPKTAGSFFSARTVGGAGARPRGFFSAAFCALPDSMELFTLGESSIAGAFPPDSCTESVCLFSSDPALIALAPSQASPHPPGHAKARENPKLPVSGTGQATVISLLLNHTAALLIFGLAALLTPGLGWYLWRCRMAPRRLAIVIGAAGPALLAGWGVHNLVLQLIGFDSVFSALIMLGGGCLAGWLAARYVNGGIDPAR